MDWLQTLLIILTIIGSIGWVFSKLDGDIKESSAKLDTDIKQAHRRMDQLYQVIIDLLKTR